MKIKLNSYKLLFRLLDILSNSKWLHKLVINPKIYLGASIISLSLINNSCNTDSNSIKNEQSGELGDETEVTTCYKPAPPATTNDSIRDSDTLIVADVPPEFLGGQNALMNYLRKNKKRSSSFQDNSESETIYVEFIINKRGNIENIRVIRGSNPLYIKEAIRLVKNMPNWIPAKNHGITVDFK